MMIARRAAFVILWLPVALMLVGGTAVHNVMEFAFGDGEYESAGEWLRFLRWPR